MMIVLKNLVPSQLEQLQLLPANKPWTNPELLTIFCDCFYLFFLLHSIFNEILYIIELTTWFVSNLAAKQQKYRDLIRQQNRPYIEVKLLNLSIGNLGIYDKCTTDFFDMLINFKDDNSSKNYIIKNKTYITIRTSYYIFCKCNEWSKREFIYHYYF